MCVFVCDIVMDCEVQHMRKTHFRPGCTLVESTMEHNLPVKMTSNCKKETCYDLNLKEYRTNECMKAHMYAPYYFGNFSAGNNRIIPPQLPLPLNTNLARDHSYSTTIAIEDKPCKGDVYLTNFVY